MTKREMTIKVLHHWWDNLEFAENDEDLHLGGNFCAYCGKYNDLTCGDGCPIITDGQSCEIDHDSPYGEVVAETEEGDFKATDIAPVWTMYLYLMNIAIRQGILNLDDFNEQGILIP